MKPGGLAGILLLLLAVLLGMMCVAAFVAVIRALMVSTTLAAIETAFGSLVVGLLLMVLSRKAWRAGIARLRGSRSAHDRHDGHDSGLQTGE